MSKGKDRYLAKAEAARLRAERAGTEALKVAWLEVAEAWIEFHAPDKRSRGERVFDELSEAQGTGQDISERSQ